MCSRCELRSLHCIYDGALHVEKQTCPRNLSPNENASDTVISTTRALEALVEQDINELNSEAFRGTVLGSSSYHGLGSALEEVPYVDWSTGFVLPEESSYLPRSYGVSVNDDVSFISKHTAVQSNSEVHFPSSEQRSIQKLGEPSLGDDIGLGEPQILSSQVDPFVVQASIDHGAATPEYQAQLYRPFDPSSISRILDSQRGQLNLFRPKKTSTTRSLLSARFLLGMLGSYPKMLLGDNTLPPFIRLPCSVPEISGLFNPKDSPENRLPESLANCASIVQMFLTKTPANSAFVWRTLRSEQQRLYDEVRTRSTGASPSSLSVSYCLNKASKAGLGKSSSSNFSFTPLNK